MEQLHKFAEVMEILQLRIDNGDYLLRPIPGERRIAEETGVSYMTARRAVTELVKNGVLIRRPNGTLETHPDYSKKAIRANVALLCPSYPSPHLSRICWIVESVLKEHDAVVRPVHFVHWDDPIVYEAITQTNGALVVPTADDIPARSLSLMRANKVVVIDADFSKDGIPSIQLFPNTHIEKVLGHLVQLGHRHIDCINAQHHNKEIDRRIGLWRQWLKKHDCTGELWSNPAPSFADSAQYAFDLIRRLIDDRKIKATAIVGTTYPATIAVVRALWERGRTVGEDISVCSMNIENHASFYCPAITGLDIPDLSHSLAKCFRWISGDSAWRGSRLLEPPDCRLFVGESSGPIAR